MSSDRAGVEVRAARSQAFIWGTAGFTGLLVASLMVGAAVSTPHHFESAAVGIGFLVAIVIGVAIGVRYRGIRIIVNDDGVDIRNFFRRRQCEWHELEQVRFRRSRIQWSPENGTPTTVVVSIAGTEIESAASTGLSLEAQRTLRRIVAAHGVVIDSVPSPEGLQQSNRRQMLTSAIALVLIAASVAVLRQDVVDAVVVLGTFVVLLIAHEAGHAAAALICRFPIMSIRLGVGPLIAHLHVGTTVELRAIPTFGEVAVLTPNARLLRLRLAGFALAGVTAASAVVALVFPYADANLRAALIVAGVLQLTNLIPHTYSTPYGERATDGLMFMHSVFGSLSGYRARDAAEKLTRHVFELAATDSDAALTEAERLHAMHPTDQTWLIALVMRLKIPNCTVTEEDERRITTMSESQLGGPSAPVVHRSVNHVAYLRLVAGETIDTRTITALRRIVDAHPDEPAVSDTLAWALIQHGEAIEGLEFSEQSLQSELPLPMRAAQLAVKGMGLAAAGRMDEARSLRADVIAIDASCPVLARLDDALAARHRKSVDPPEGS